MKKSPNPARQAYLKKWRKDHPVKISEYNKRYWEKRAMREQMEQKEMGKDGQDKTVSDL